VRAIQIPVHRQDPPLAIVLIYPDAWEAQVPDSTNRALVSGVLVEAAFAISDVAPLAERRPTELYDQEQHPEGTS